MSALREVPVRSALFTPATRPDRVAKLADIGTDLGIIDLEDAVAPGAKAEARTSARVACEQLAREHPALRVAVRVNALASPWFEGDVAEGLHPWLSGVVVPKVSSTADLRSVRAALEAVGLAHLGVVAGIETGAGVLHVEEVAASGQADLVYFGAEDLTADLGGERTPGGLEVLYARSRVVLAARVAGLGALDQVVPAFDDDVRFRHDAHEGRALGYTGKMCIHPRQVALAHRAFTPDARAVAAARAVVDGYEEALARGEGVVVIDGQMVDQPMLARARATLAAAGPTTTRGAP